MLHYLGYLAAVFIGLALGIMGGGGSILTVPVPVYLMGVSPVLSTAYSLFVVGSTPAVGASGYFRKGLVSLKTALVFLGPSLLAVFAVRKMLLPAIPPELFTVGSLVFTKDLLVLVAFAVLMVGAAASMIRRPPAAEGPEAAPRSPVFNYPLMLGIGLVVGTLTGFVEAGGGLLADQPFIPKYFGYDVALNKAGATPYAPSVRQVPRLPPGAALAAGALVVDARPEAKFKQGHVAGAINLQQGGKFETWLGSVVGPKELFYLVAAHEATRENLIQKAANIGYESLITGALVSTPTAEATLPVLEVDAFRRHPEQYTIVDIRNATEHRDEPLFAGSLNIPLPELRERAPEIPTDKPVVVHCAGGYRSAAGSSIVADALPNTRVLDLGEAVKSFQPAPAAH